MMTVTVDLKESHHHAIQQIAKERNISIDHLFTEIIQEFVDHYKSLTSIEIQEMIDRINEVYSDESVQNDTLNLTRRMQPLLRNLVEDTW